MNYSLRTLLFVMAGVCVVVASLVYAAPVVGDLYYTLGLLVIAFAVLAAMYCRSSTRAFWVGFLVLFAGYFGHSVWPSEVRSTWTMVQRLGGVNYASQGLITSRVLTYMFEGLHGPITAPTGGIGLGRATMQGAAMAAQYVAFMTVGHTALALLLGLTGGAVAERLASRTGRAIIGANEEAAP